MYIGVAVGVSSCACPWLQMGSYISPVFWRECFLYPRKLVYVVYTANVPLLVPLGVHMLGYTLLYFDQFGGRPPTRAFRSGVGGGRALNPFPQPRDTLSLVLSCGLQDSSAVFMNQIRPTKGWFNALAKEDRPTVWYHAR